ncbi:MULTISPECIES: hypothetical protein [Xenorhabdus]|uniref:hypothetical protein n=1 Tax=Xenorhabdus TaxID=626 RepID=UPI0006468D14|nr:MULTISPECIES: hypothetical protein [Xenorhabdus]
MTATMRRYMRAIGSVMDIMPSTNYRSIITSGNDAQKLRNDAHNIARDMTGVIVGCGEIANERKPKAGK